MNTEQAGTQDKTHDPSPLLTGHDLIRHRLLDPGPRLAIILTQVREAQRAGIVKDEQEALQWIAHRLASGV